MTATLETAPTRTRASQPDTERTGSPWLGFAAIITAMILNLMDSTILNVAAPSVARDLHTSSAQLEWIAAAYTLAIAVGLLTGGRLGDRYGRRRMLLIGITGFVLASTACALATSPEALITARIVQGLSAALLTPQTFGLIRDLFPAEQLGKAFAAFGPVIGMSLVIGPVIAGLLIKANLFGTDWRALFLINVPLGLFAILLGRRVLPAGRVNRGIRLDVTGTILIGIASFLLVFPLVDGRSLGWPVWIFGVLAGAVPALAVFVAQQCRRIRAGATPLVELSVLSKRSFTSGVIFTLVFFGSVTGFSLTIGLFLQLGLGFTPMHAALYVTALAIGATIGSGVGAWAISAVGRPILHVGLMIMAVGIGVLLLSLHSGTPGASTVLPGLGVFGLGMGMIFVPLFSIIVADIEDHEVGSASAMLESLQQLGSSLGIAVLATLFFGRLAHGSVTAIEVTLWATLGLVAVAFALGWLLPQHPRDGHAG